MVYGAGLLSQALCWAGVLAQAKVSRWLTGPGLPSEYMRWGPGPGWHAAGLLNQAFLGQRMALGYWPRQWRRVTGPGN